MCLRPQGMAELYAGRSLTEQTSWSFLALMWGLVADVDLESEACRCFGAARFDVYSAVRAPLSSAVLVPVLLQAPASSPV